MHSSNVESRRRLDRARLDLEPGDLIALHDLGLADYLAAQREADSAERARLLLRVVMYWSPVLAERDYFLDFSRLRAEVYGAAVESSQAEEARTRVLTLLEEQLAETAQELVDLFHLELHVTALLRQQGGLKATPTAQPLACGPLLLDYLRLQPALCQHVQPGVLPDDSSLELRELFSSLGPAACLLRRGHGERALVALRAMACADCGGSPPPAGLPQPAVWPRLCLPNCQSFGRRNYSYVGLGKEAFGALRADALHLSCAAHLMAARQHALDAQVDLVIAHGQSAVAIGRHRGPDQEEAALESIAELLSAAAAALRRDDKRAAALALLQGCGAAFSLAAVQPLHAQLLVDRAIEQWEANEHAAALASLREAHRLDPTARRPRQNLLRALFNYAGHKTRSNDHREAVALLREARPFATTELEENPESEDLRTILREIDVGITVLESGANEQGSLLSLLSSVLRETAGDEAEDAQDNPATATQRPAAPAPLSPEEASSRTVASV